MKQNTYLRSLLLVLFSLLILSQCAFAQIENELKLDRKPPTAYDSLLAAISVPEIDPRQYMIIYEWKESNVKKSRKGIKDESRLREVARYNLLVDEKLGELRTKKEAIKRQLVLIYSIDSLYNQLDTINNNAVNADWELKMKAKFIEIDRTFDLKHNFIPGDIADIYDSLRVQRNQIKEEKQIDSQELEMEISELEKFQAKLIHQRKYIHWQYNPENNPPYDSTKYNEYKPYDFFEEIGKEYSGLQESFEEYYNDIIWRNAATPDWEPIWWLNQYPWPNLDYRNIDLIDQDYRDNRFALIPYQKYAYVDYKSVLRVVFDKTQLARNEHFKGSIGLDAFLYEGGAGGDPREIEINPYSVIGEERESIGLSNRPAGELTDNLITLIKKAGEISKPIPSLYDEKVIELRIERMKYNLGEAIKILEKEDTLSLENQRNLIDWKSAFCKDFDFIEANGSDYVFSGDCDDFRSIRTVNNQGLVVKLKRIQSELTSQSTNNKTTSFNFHLNKMRERREEIRLVLNFLNYFNEEHGNTRDAFLDLIGKDKITFKYLLGRIKGIVSKIDQVLPKLKKSSAQDSTEFREDYKSEDTQLGDYFSRLGILMGRLANIEGSHLDNVIKKIWESNPSLAEIGSSNSIDKIESDNFNNRNKEALRKLEIIYSINETRLDLREYLAEKAGEILYQDLVYGTVDLDLADAKDGDVLYIRMFWDKDAIKDGFDDESTIPVSDEVTPASNEATPGNAVPNVIPPPLTPTTVSNENTKSLPQRDGLALYVAKFKLIKTGWRFYTSDNAMLVNRIGEDLLRSDYPLSPSQFKLMGGAAVTWGLRNDFRTHKKIKFDPNTNFPKFNKRGKLKYNKFGVFTERTFKWLEPSFGLNFSYLDFNTTKGFEFGLGPTLGLFANTIYISAGYNLMEYRERPFYIGIGASFVNLGTKVTTIATPAGTD